MAFRYFEFKEEAVSGTAETTPEMSCDPMSVSPGLPDGPEMEYKGGMGRGRTIHRPGQYSTKPKTEIGTDLKVFARMLFFALGRKVADVTEGSTGPDVSTEYIYPTDNVLLPTFTSFMGIDLKEFVIPGCVLDKLEMTADKDFLTLKLEMAGMGETVGTIKTKSQLKINDDYPLAFFEVNVHMREKGSSTTWGTSTLISDDVSKLVLSIENGAKADNGFGLGSRFPHKIPVGERKIGFKFDYDYLSQKWYDLYQGSSTGPNTTGSTEFEFMVAIDAGSYGTAQLFFPRVIVSKAPVEAKGRDALSQGIECDCYQEDLTIASSPATTAYAEMLGTFTLNFDDSTTSFDGPTWAGNDDN